MGSTHRARTQSSCTDSPCWCLLLFYQTSWSKVPLVSSTLLATTRLVTTPPSVTPMGTLLPQLYTMLLLLCIHMLFLLFLTLAVEMYTEVQFLVLSPHLT